MSRTVGDWIVALRDCGVIRVRFDDDALIQGIEVGAFEASPVDGDDDALDVRLSPQVLIPQPCPGTADASSLRDRTRRAERTLLSPNPLGAQSPSLALPGKVTRAGGGQETPSDAASAFFAGSR